MGKKLRMKIEMKPMRLGDIIELFDERGAAFGTKEARKKYFERLDEDYRNVRIGAAIGHAKGKRLSIWSSKEALYEDCARIMAYELKKLIDGAGQKPDISAEDVSKSRTFRRFFDIARLPKEAALENFVRALGNNSSHMEERRYHVHESFSFQNLYEKLLTEIMFKREGKDFRRYEGRPGHREL